MLIIKQIQFKNLLSFGNTFEKVIFDSNNILILGKNGNGKSAILEAITYALFGKPFRNINLPQMINSINKKGLLVEIDISIDNDNYKIIRGKSPSIFEIYLNGQMLPQDANTKDYQDILEEQIIKMNIDTFRQIVILGTASFTPFMLLKPTKRKDIIENLLDISLFSLMNIILKEEISIFSTNYKELQHKYDIVNAEYKIKKQHHKSNIISIEKQKKNIIDKISLYDNDIKKFIQNSEQLSNEISLISEKIKNKNKESFEKRLKKFNTYNIQFNHTIQQNKSEQLFIKENNICPKCEQNISEEYKIEKIRLLQEKETVIIDAISKLNKNIAEDTQTLKDISELEIEMKRLESEKRISLHNIKSNRSFVSSLQNDIDELNKTSIKNDDSINVHKEEIKQLQESIKEADKKKEIYNICLKLLKDDGVKKAIVSYYLPIINSIINFYLDKMGFQISFLFNESFEETLKSRYRDAFSYNCFSEGEKKRIDIALLFAFRKIAKMKNNASCNLLILDEVLDSSLDIDGLDFLLQSLAETDEPNCCNIIISHRPEIKENTLFDKILTLSKENGFSKIKSVSYE